MKFLEVENKKVNWKYISIVILFAILSGAFTFIYFDSFPVFSEIPLVTELIKPKESIKPIEPELKGWRVFTNNELGFSFKYPAAWGNPQEEIRHGDTGEKYLIDFANMRDTNSYKINYFYVVGVSRDFVSGMGTWRGDYKGEIDISNAAINTKLWAKDCVIPNFINIDFNLPGKRISGVRLFVPILSDNDIKKFNTKCPCVPREERQADRQGICIYEDERMCLAMYVDTGRYEPELFYEMLENKYVGPSIAVEEYFKKLKKESLDSTTQERIEIFKEIFDSSRVF